MANKIFTKEDTERMKRVVPGLLEWYHRNARALPWRCLLYTSDADDELISVEL